MGKWCLYASLFIFDWIIIKVAGNQDRHESSVEFDFRPNQTTHFGATCPWVTKISHFRTWISLKPVGQSWSNFMCIIIGVGERLHKVLGHIDLGTLDSGERSLPFGLLVVNICRKTVKIRMSRVTFLCLPRSSKFQKYEQRGKHLNLFCFLKSDVIPVILV